MFCVIQVTWSTVDLPCRKPACSILVWNVIRSKLLKHSKHTIKLTVSPLWNFSTECGLYFRNSVSQAKGLLWYQRWIIVARNSSSLTQTTLPSWWDSRKLLWSCFNPLLYNNPLWGVFCHLALQSTESRLSLFRHHGWSSPRCTMMFFHCILLRAVSHKFQDFCTNL